MSDNSDLETKIIDAVYRGTCDASELKWAVGTARRTIFTVPAWLLGELDLAQPNRSFVIGANNIDHATSLRAIVSGGGLDPAPRAYAALPVGKAAFSNALFSRSERRASPFFNEFLVPQGLSASIGAPLLSHGGRIAQIGIFQDAHRSYDDQSEILRLERLTPPSDACTADQAGVRAKRSPQQGAGVDCRSQRNRIDRPVRRGLAAVRERSRTRHCRSW